MNSRFRGQFLPISQCFLSFVQRFFASVQFRFALSKLLFGRVISFLARAKQRKRDKQRQNESSFHNHLWISLVWWCTKKSGRFSMSNESYRSWGVGDIVDLTATTSTASCRERWTLAKTASMDRQIRITAINRTALVGARGVSDFSVLSSGRFTT
jgi:hypothetical protein